MRSSDLWAYNGGKRWNDKERELLIHLHGKGLNWYWIGKEMKRSPISVKIEFKKLTSK